MMTHLNDLQRITLQDILTTAGLTENQIDIIHALLAFKRPEAQLAFYYRSQGMTYEEVGERLWCSTSKAYRLVQKDCENIATFLRET